MNGVFFGLGLRLDPGVIPSVGLTLVWQVFGVEGNRIRGYHHNCMRADRPSGSPPPSLPTAPRGCRIA